MDMAGSREPPAGAFVLLVWEQGTASFLAYNGTNMFSLGAEGE